MFKIITEECCVELKKGQAIEAVGEAVLLTTNGTPSMDTSNSNYRFHLLWQAVSYYNLGVALCEKFVKSRPSYWNKELLSWERPLQKKFKCWKEEVKESPERIEAPSKLQSTRARLLVCIKTVVEDLDIRGELLMPIYPMRRGSRPYCQRIIIFQLWWWETLYDICRLQTADCRLQTADRRPQTADCRLQTADCRLQTAVCRLHEAARL